MKPLQFMAIGLNHFYDNDSRAPNLALTLTRRARVLNFPLPISFTGNELALWN